jgi:hypothetical protein
VTIAWRIQKLIARRTNTLKDMNEKPDQGDSSLSETMVARFEIKELGDPARERKIVDAVVALDGVTEAKIEKSALHVSYDPLATTDRSSKLSAPRATRSKPRPQRQRLRIQICQRRQM